MKTWVLIREKSKRSVKSKNRFAQDLALSMSKHIPGHTYIHAYIHTYPYSS
jgi:hypothetical protein